MLSHTHTIRMTKPYCTQSLKYVTKNLLMVPKVSVTPNPQKFQMMMTFSEFRVFIMILTIIGKQLLPLTIMTMTFSELEYSNVFIFLLSKLGETSK